jgi:hypothetical protein
MSWVRAAAAIEGRCARQRLHVVRLRQALEGSGVDVDRVRIERDGLAAPDETCWVRRGQRSTESKEGLPEATARLGLRSIAPEKRRELVPRVGLPRGPREVSQQRLGLAGAEPQRRPGSEPGLEVARSMSVSRIVYPRSRVG